MTQDTFLYENHDTGVYYHIPMADILEIAVDQGDDRALDEIDDASWYRYCEFYLGV